VLCNVPTLDLFAVGIRGSLLALETDLTGMNGDIYGNVYIASFVGFIQFSYLPSNACSTVIPPAPPAVPTVIYDSIPTPLADGFPSQGYECCGVTQTGDHIIFDDGVPKASPRLLVQANVTMVSWARWAGDDYYQYFPYSQNNSYWSQNITFNIYAANADNTLGALLGSVTDTFTCPYRPENDPSCDITSPVPPVVGQVLPQGRFKNNGVCVYGLPFVISFNLTSLNLVAPDDIIFGVTFNTQTFGFAPTGTVGPYNSLNFAYAYNATIGEQWNNTQIWINSTYAFAYGDSGPTGVFRQTEDDPENSWLGYTPSVRISAIVAPVTPSPPAVPVLEVKKPALEINRPALALKKGKHSKLISKLNRHH